MSVLQQENRRQLAGRAFKVGRSSFAKRVLVPDLKYEDGLVTFGIGIVPHPETIDHRDCPGCGKHDAAVMRWPDREQLLPTAFVCCGWPA